MNANRHMLRRMTMALAVAYLIVLQALLGGVSSGAHAGSLAGLDPLAQVLCLTGHAAPAAPADPAHHTPDCCTTGCQAPAFASPPSPVAALAVPAARLIVAERPLPGDAVPTSGLERSPRHTRAPPLA